MAGCTVIELPVPSKIPPHYTTYQYQLEFVPSTPFEILNIVLSPGQIAVEVAVIEPAAVEVSLTVIVTLVHKVVLQIPSALI